MRNYEVLEFDEIPEPIRKNLIVGMRALKTTTEDGEVAIVPFTPELESYVSMAGFARRVQQVIDDSDEPPSYA